VQREPLNTTPEPADILQTAGSSEEADRQPGDGQRRMTSRQRRFDLSNASHSQPDTSSAYFTAHALGGFFSQVIS
jgi:hypothetical protein